jgi:hypothetical protein
MQVQRQQMGGVSALRTGNCGQFGRLNCGMTGQTSDKRQAKVVKDVKMAQ